MRGSLNGAERPRMRAGTTALGDSAAIAARSGARPPPLLRSLRYLLAAVAMPFASLWRRLRSGRRRRSAERYFRALPDAILRDIGIARTEISHIAAEPPESWPRGRDGAHAWRGAGRHSGRNVRRSASRRR